MAGEALNTLMQKQVGCSASFGKSNIWCRDTSRCHAALPRKQESESDRMGLIFMAMAGYNPEKAPAFWERMATQGSSTPPNF